MTVLGLLLRQCSRAPRAAALLAVLAVGQAQVVTSFDLFELNFYTQTTSDQPCAPTSYDFSARIFVSASVADATASVSGPNDTSYNLCPNGMVFEHSESFSSQSAMNESYPTGDYYFSLSSCSVSGSGTLTLPCPYYALSTPYFTNFNCFQNLDANQDFVFRWNGFDTNEAASLSQIFLVITDTSQSVTVLNQFIADPNTTCFNVVAGTLTPGDSYTATIYFSSRDVFPEAWSEGAQGLVAFDRGTTAAFSASAIPEPSTTALVVGGVFGWVALRRRFLAGRGIRG